MAQTIKLKRSAQSGASGIPGTSDLALGEVGINTYHGKMYIKKNDGSDSIVEISADKLPLTGGTLTGALTANAGVTVDTINIDGNTIATTSGNFFIDSASDIYLDADGANIFLRDDGTNFGNFNHNGNNLKISSTIQDGDIVFAGNDGGSTITALTLDMSDAGTATFNHDVKLFDNSILFIGTSPALALYHTGTNSHIQNSTGALINTTATFVVNNAANTETLLNAYENGAVSLFYDNSVKLATTSTGINVTGSVTASTSMRVSDGEAYGFGDNSYRIEGKDDGANARIGFITGSSERMRIDASGNLLVGTTSTIPFTLSSGTGAGINSSGTVMAGAAAEAGLFNRIGSDGAIIQLYKAGSIVGGVGVVGGDDLFIAGGSTGLRFDSGVGKIYPTNGSGTVSDNTVDIGEVNYQFKDLHLSGTANVGGITVNSAFTFPTADGSSGQALVTDGSGNVTFGAVSAGAASSMVDADGDTKIQIEESSDEDKIRFDTAGVERMIIDNAGNVGIGTDTPTGYSGQTNLNINSTGVSRIDFDISDTLEGYLLSEAGYLAMWGVAGSHLMFGSNNTERMRIDTSGRVGIGTTTPAFTLDVTGSFRATSDAYLQGDLYVNDKIRHNGDVDNYIGFPAADTQIFVTANSERMRITSAGNVGIGTTSPGGPLHVKSSTNKTIIADATFSSGSFTSLAFQRNGTDKWRILQQSDDSHLSFYNDATSAYQFSLKSDGNVGIGTTAPAHLLHVHKPSSGDAALMLETVTGGDPTIIFNSAAANRSGLIKFQDNGTNVGRIQYVHNGDRIDFHAGSATGTTLSIAEDKVGIGTTAPGAPLVVNASSSSSGIRVQRNGASGQYIGIHQDSNHEHVIDSVSISGAEKGFRIFNTTSGSNSYIRFGTSNAEKMRINASGNLGIGTTAPSSLLTVDSGTVDDVYTPTAFNDKAQIKIDVASTQNNYAAIQFTHSGNTEGFIGFVRPSTHVNDADFVIQGYSSATSAYAEKMRITDEGSVGIGTSSPVSTLHVNGGGYFTSFVNPNGSGVGGLELGYDGTQSVLQSYHRGTSSYKAIHMNAAHVAFNIGGVEKARVHTNGNVGIGTTAPQEKLEVNGNILLTGSGSIRGGGTNTNMDIGTSSSGSTGLLTLVSTGDIRLFQYGSSGPWTTNVTFKGDGNVGIGTTSPSKQLTVNGADAEFLLSRTGSYADTITMGMPSGVPTIVGGTDLAFGGTGTWTEHMRIKADGKVGIGTTAPSSKLDVVGHIEAGSFEFNALSGTAVHGTGLRVPASQTMSFHTNSAERMRITSTGKVGIGITPVRVLDIATTTGGTIIHLTDDATGHTATDGVDLQQEGTLFQILNREAGDIRFGTDNTERVRIDSSGNVGIGRTPSAFNSAYRGLQIGGTGGNGITLAGNDASIGTGYYLSGLGTYAYDNSSATASMINMYNREFVFKTAASGSVNGTITWSESMRIDSSGNVGIGTTSPTQKLEIVESNNYKGIHIRGSVAPSLTFGRSANTTQEWKVGISGVNGNNFAISTGTGSGEKLVVDTSGNVGIGTTAPAHKLDILTSTDQQIPLRIKNNDSDSSTFMRFEDNGGQYWDTGINYANNDYYLSYGGTTRSTFTNAGGLNLYGSGNSILTLNIGTTAGNYSALNVGRTDGGGTAHITPAVTGGVPISGIPGILLGSTNGSIPAVGIQTPNSSNGHIVFNPKGSEKVRITADGNVGIGTTSMYSGAKLSVNGSIVQSNNGQHVIGTFGTSGLQLIGIEGGDCLVGTMGGSEPLLFRTASAERMRLDTSGNLLVGKTTTAIGTQGIRLEGHNGKIEATRSGNIVTAFNRTGSDGTISEWMKDGSTVGSIGSSNGGERLYMVNDSTGFSFLGDFSRILPCDSAGTARDAAIDLGQGSGGRFKDLYLSGTISSGAATFTTADNLNVLTLICTDADANAGPNVKLFRNSSSPADGDNLGRIDFIANNDAAEQHNFARIAATVADASNATEDGTLEFSTSVATTENVSRILMGATETVINEDSADLDFRVESNGNANMLFVDAGNNRVGIGRVPTSQTFEVAGFSHFHSGAVFNEDSADVDFRVESNGNANMIRVDGGNNRVGIGESIPTKTLSVLGDAIIKNTVDGTYLTLHSTQANNASGPDIILFRDSTSPADDDALSTIFYQGKNSVGSTKDYMKVRTHIADVTDGTEDFGMDIQIMTAGNAVNALDIIPAELVINNAGIDRDFRVESDGNQHALFVRGSDGNVGIGDSSPSKKLDVYQSTTGIGVADFRHVNGNRILINPSYNYHDAYNHIFRGLNGTDTHMTIDNTGRVGIGTSSPQTSTKGLHVVHDANEGTPSFPDGEVIIAQRNYNSSQGCHIAIIAGSASESVINFGDKDDSDIGNLTYNHSSNDMRFTTNTAERMRIDSSGRVLVGGTSAFGADTITLGTGGFAGIRNTSGSCLELRRDSTDGSILDFQKDGTTAGLVGVKSDTSNPYIVIGKGSVGLQFASDTDAVSVLPARADNLSLTNGAMDIGSSTQRFRDLYLSGKAQADTYEFAQNSGATNATDAIYRATTATIAFKTGGSEKMRLSGGNLLVGTTNTAAGAGNSETGISLRGGTDNRSFFSVNQNYVMHLNRKGNSGNILEFAQDGSNVGSIGTVSGDVTIDGGSEHTGLRFEATDITPRHNGAASNGVNDLGTSAAKFKDLYLSGSVIANGSILSTTGSAAAAAIRPNNDINCGIFFPAANTFAVTTNGSEAFRVDVHQNLGIGTSAPSAKLEIGGMSAGEQAFLIESPRNDALSNGLARINITDVNCPFTGLQIDHAGTGLALDVNGNATFSGGVGIGTTAPAHLLDILKTGSGDATINIKSTTGGDPTIIFNSAAANRSGLIKYQDNGTNVGRIEYVHNGDRIDFQAGSATSATMSVASGKVGIGTTAPDAPLEVKRSSDGSHFRLARSGVGSWDFKVQNTPTLPGVGAGALELIPTVGNSYFAVGISGGSTTLLHVKNTGIYTVDGSQSSPSYSFNSDNDTGMFRPTTNVLAFGTAGTERMRILSSGSVVIAGSSFAAANAASFGLNGSAYFDRASGTVLSLRRNTDYGKVLQFIDDDENYVGHVTINSNSTVTYSSSSDERLKENIQNAESASEKIDNIKVRQFDWKSDGSHQDYGMVAQELINVAPEAVSTGDTEDDMMGVDYSKLVPMLIKEIQELRQRVAQLEE